MTGLFCPRQLSALIGLIYDCTLDPSRWDDAIDGIRDALRCDSIILSLNDLRSGTLLIDKSVGWPEEWRRRRNGHLAEIHARISEWLAEAPCLDAPFIASRHLPEDYAASSAYIKEVLAPLGIVDVMHLFLVRTPAHISELVSMHHQRYGVVTERETEVAALLLPHLRRAVTISRVLEAREIGRQQMAGALDALQCGVVLTDRDGAILHPNRAAEAVLDKGNALQDAGGYLRACNPAASRELRAAIRLAAQDETALGMAGLAVRLDPSGTKPLFAHVLPLAGGQRRDGMQAEASAAVFISTQPDERIVATAMATAFRLTRAERRLLARLLAGKTLAEAAGILGVAPTTAKTHLENIFSKTGVSRQADLMRLAMQALPPAALPN